MSKFLRPQRTPPLPQGAYKFLPKVKGFGPHSDMTSLDTDINVWLLLQTTLPDLYADVIDVKFQATLSEPPGAEVGYTALVHYTLIEVN